MQKIAMHLKYQKRELEKKGKTGKERKDWRVVKKGLEVEAS